MSATFSIERLAEAIGDRRPELVAGELGVTVQTLWRWRTGKTQPKADQVAKLAFLTGKPLHWFFVPDEAA